MMKFLLITLVFLVLFPFRRKAFAFLGANWRSVLSAVVGLLVAGWVIGMSMPFAGGQIMAIPAVLFVAPAIVLFVRRLLKDIFPKDGNRNGH